MPFDTLRALAVGRQALVDVPVSDADITWLDFVTDFGHKPNLTKDTPKFKINHRWMERNTFSKTRFDEVTVKGHVDSTEIGWFLCGGYGPPTDVGNAHTFLAGSTQVIPVSATNSMLLTVMWQEGLDPLYWMMYNAKVNKLAFALDATGDLTFEATLRGLKALPLTAPHTAPNYDPPPDNTPFQPWQTVLSLNGSPVCIVSMKWDILNNFNPFYCTPVVPPVIGEEAGLYPQRFTDGEVVGTYDIIYEYDDDAPPGPFYDYRHDIYEGWVLESIDPNSGQLWTPTFHAEFPRLAGTDGELDRSKPNVLQSVKGVIDFDAGLGSGTEIVLTNGLTGYTAH